ncbi:hypothetical protein DPMN_003437 [Dreissena polymorpha]|uniref:Uncharacterized protein n=1 Tax=Dreissena polymorpha TaxID=45954 RepID=A0A9D4MPP2_DREPO|nr:hypothetical protein DPMN_003437 [Dreissena polymorpha]
MNIVNLTVFRDTWRCHPPPPPTTALVLASRTRIEQARQTAVHFNNNNNHLSRVCNMMMEETECNNLLKLLLSQQ